MISVVLALYKHRRMGQYITEANARVDERSKLLAATEAAAKKKESNPWQPLPSN